MVLMLIGISLIPMFNAVWATTDLSTLGSPDVTIYPNSGPPGTKITITISHIPDISKASYPFPDLFVYLPFSQPFGNTLSSHCEGQDCFPVYTYNDALNQDFSNRTITFSLPSTNNPTPIYLNGMENAICDVLLNGKTIERFSTLCNTKSEPQGLYQIKIAWVLESDPEQEYVVKTIPFIVTPQTMSPSNTIADKGNIILEEYQNGTISQTQFYNELKSRGWTDEQVRQALAVIGKLPHQIGIEGPDNKLIFSQINSSTPSETNASVSASIEKIPPTTPAIKSDTNATQVEPRQKSQNRSSEPLQENTSTNHVMLDNSTSQSPQNNSLWNGVIIGLCIAVAAIMAGVTIFVKIQRGKRNA